jgi:hypothetical protein
MSYEKVVDRFDLGVRAVLTTAKKSYTCRESRQTIYPGEQYYTIKPQYGVAPHPPRVKPEYLAAYFAHQPGVK